MRSILLATLPFAVGFAVWASDSSAQMTQRDQQFSQQPQVNQQQLGRRSSQRDQAPVVLLRDWNYDTIYGRGWSLERLIDEAEVIGATGEEIGDIENVIIGQDGRILGIIAEIGGFLDIGDTHVFVPWDQVRVSPDLQRVTTPVYEDNLDAYNWYNTEYLTQSRTQRTRVVDDDLATGPRVWKATELLNDDVFLNDRAGYGRISDLIFTDDGYLHAIVVNAAAGWGGGYYAYPFYGYDYGWSPGASSYNLGYDRDEIRNLEPFEYNRMRSRVTMRNEPSQAAVTERDSARTPASARANVWTFRDIDSDGNLELSSREFAPVGRDVFASWDTNQNGRLERAEFHSGLFRLWDTNNDGQLTANEVRRGARDWDLRQQNLISQLDNNRDGLLTLNEFRSGMTDVGLYDRWDQRQRGWLTPNDFSTGLYDVWDRNRDGVLAQNEFNDYAASGWL